MAAKMQFLYLLRLVRPETFDSPTPAEEAILAAHFVRLKASLESGELLLAGPTLDGAFGVVIFEAASEAAARAYMESDPAVRNGVMTAELHPMRVSLMAGR